MYESDMIEQIKQQLGAPVIDIEATDDQIKNCIKIAILMAKDHIQVRRFKSFCVGKKIDKVIPAYSWSVDLSELDFEIVTNVYRGDLLSPYLYDTFYLVNYATRGVSSAMAALINQRSNIDALINRQWKVIDKTLFLDKYYTGVTVEFIPKVITLDDIDDNYWIGWVLRYSTALVKEVLSRIRGKFEVDSNPFKTDAATLAQEASTEKESLLQEIEGRGFLTITR